MKDLKLDHSDKIADHVQKMDKSGIREFFDLVIGCDDVISLGVGEPDFVTPEVIRQRVVSSLSQGQTSYTSNQGLMSLREAICKYIEKDYGVEYCPKTECLITVGVSEALDLAMRALVNPGDEVIYSEPCYVSYKAEIKLTHGIPVLIENTAKTEFSLDIEQLKAKVTPKAKILMLNFPCNPTGATLNLEQMQDIAEVAVKNDLIVFTDEIYSELSYIERLPTIASLPGMRERTVFLHGFSKAFAMTGFRIGYACGPAEIIAAMNKIHQYTILCAPIMAQRAAEEALESGIEPMDFAKKLLEEQRVAVVPGTAFGACGEGYIRCCYAASTEKLKEALRKIKIFVESLDK